MPTAFLYFCAECAANEHGHGPAGASPQIGFRSDEMWRCHAHPDGEVLVVELGPALPPSRPTRLTITIPTR